MPFWVVEFVMHAKVPDVMMQVFVPVTVLVIVVVLVADVGTPAITRMIAVSMFRLVMMPVLPSVNAIGKLTSRDLSYSESL